MMNERVIPRFAALVALAVVAGAAQQAQALPLTVADEGSLEFSNFKYFRVGDTGSAIVDIQNGYVICANTNWFSGSPTHEKTRIVSRNGGLDTDSSPRFKFGEVNLTNELIANDDVRFLSIGVGGGGLRLGSISTSQVPGTLGCYGLNASGNRVIWYNGLFVDNFEAAPSKACPSNDVTDPCVSVRVASITADTANNRLLYKYYVDYYLPAADAAYVVRDGYDSQLINGAVTSWCDGESGATECTFPTLPLNNRTIDVLAVGTSAHPTTRRVVVQRATKNGVNNISAISTPVVMAALFPEYAVRSIENQADNNVAIGTGSLSNFAPIINTSGVDIKGLVEGGPGVPVSFQLTDDSTESSGNLLRATVSVNFNGNTSSPTVNCGSATPQPGPGASRTCSFSLTTPSANFATDRLPGTYAPGVSASVTINSTDPQGAVASAAPIAVHVASADNDPPSFTLAASATHSDPMPTITCSLAALSGECTAAQNLSNGEVRFSSEANGVKSLAAFVSARAGATDSVDELAAQTTSFVPDTSTGRGGNIKCTLDSGSLEIFRPSTGGPKLSPASPSASFALSFGLNEVNIGSATCDVIVNDAQAGGFQVGQSSITAPTQQFRIVVTN